MTKGDEDADMLKLYHCRGARSFRVLWALEELAIPHELVVLGFPPRQRHPEFLEINPLGTIPFLTGSHGLAMSESSAIIEYLAEKHPEGCLAVPRDDLAYGTYLNFLHMSDATLTFPQTIYLRYTQLEKPEKRVPHVAEDYRRWFLARLQAAFALFRGTFTCGATFTAADIAVGYALKLATMIGLKDDLPDYASNYFDTIKSRPAYRRALAAERA